MTSVSASFEVHDEGTAAQQLVQKAVGQGVLVHLVGGASFSDRRKFCNFLRIAQSVWLHQFQYRSLTLVWAGNDLGRCEPTELQEAVQGVVAFASEWDVKLRPVDVVTFSNAYHFGYPFISSRISKFHDLICHTSRNKNGLFLWCPKTRLLIGKSPKMCITSLLMGLFGQVGFRISGNFEDIFCRGAHDSKSWSQRGDCKTQITFGRGVVVTENDGRFVVASQGTMGKSTLENQPEFFS